MTSTALLCLIFLGSPSPESPPENVQTLLKQRIKHQWSQHRPDVSIEFNESACENKGKILYAQNHMDLTADFPYWRGTQSMSYRDILDGRSISFENVSPKIERNSIKPHLALRKTQFRKKWLPWVLAAVGVGVTATLIHQRNQQIKKINAFNLSF